MGVWHCWSHGRSQGGRPEETWGPWSVVVEKFVFTDLFEKSPFTHLVSKPAHLLLRLFPPPPYPSLSLLGRYHRQIKFKVSSLLSKLSNIWLVFKGTSLFRFGTKHKIFCMSFCYFRNDLSGALLIFHLPANFIQKLQIIMS